MGNSHSGFCLDQEILDALCQMDPEVVRLESTESSDKNQTMNSTSSAETDIISYVLWTIFEKDICVTT